MGKRERRIFTEDFKWEPVRLTETSGRRSHCCPQVLRANPSHRDGLAKTGCKTGRRFGWETMARRGGARRVRPGALFA
jgi:hypothetical protein